jgi:hypothetical protein
MFIPITATLALADPCPPTYTPIATRPLLILVGVTGVGKSTTIAALPAAGLQFTLLPDRRELTDRLMIEYLQRRNGETVQPVTDRTARFAYTRAYRELHPGGMADALASLSIHQEATGLLLFDGLRGASEVQAAAQRLPNACFAVLDAPNFVRVQRLLKRNDAFDQATVASTLPTAPQGDSLASQTGLTLDDLLTPTQSEYFLTLLARGELTLTDLQAKLKIVLEERRSYDPAAAIAMLQQVAPDRTYVIDTTTHSPNQAAMAIAAFTRGYHAHH